MMRTYFLLVQDWQHTSFLVQLSDNNMSPSSTRFATTWPQSHTPWLARGRIVTNTQGLGHFTDTIDITNNTYLPIFCMKNCGIGVNVPSPWMCPLPTSIWFLLATILLAVVMLNIVRYL